MDVAGTAVGIASLGIQVCQGILWYYDGFKNQESDIKETYDGIASVQKTLELLKASFDSGEMDSERVSQVRKCLESCKDGILELEKKAEKLQKCKDPKGLQQQARSGFERLAYPFRRSTLVKLQDLARHVQSNLALALQVLHLDVSVSTKRVMDRIATTTIEIDTRTVAIEASIAQNSLQTQQIRDQTQQILDEHQTKEIIKWLSAPDPWTNHQSARQKHEPQTGAWLLASKDYTAWKSGSDRHLCLFGQAGCGKTILCSVVIDDMQLYVQQKQHTGLAVFYFSFSDSRKQTESDLIRSLLLQLGSKGPASLIVQKAFKNSRADGHGPTVSELTSILTEVITQYKETYVILDALDECPEDNDARFDVLQFLQGLSGECPQLKILATSRELESIRKQMMLLQASIMPISKKAINEDIRVFVASQLSGDPRFNRFTVATKSLMEETLLAKADGMFRWAFCQIEELTKLKRTNARYVEKVLNSLPRTLDETYERMLAGIDAIYHAEAIVLLNWIAYAKRPPTLGELMEAVIVDPSGKGTVHYDYREECSEGFLGILSGLITVTTPCSYYDKLEEISDHEYLSEVRIAHFSVQEYLESDRLQNPEMQRFRLESSKGHKLLAHSCVTYLTYYSMSPLKSSVPEDLKIFPLLYYAAEFWPYHSQLQGPVGFEPQISLLKVHQAVKDWYGVLLNTFDDNFHFIDFESIREDAMMEGAGGTYAELPTGLYYASEFGLEAVAKALIDEGADINHRGYMYLGLGTTALQVAARNGHTNIVNLLIRNGANVDSGFGLRSAALGAAAEKGHKEIVELLITNGASINRTRDPERAAGSWDDVTPLHMAAENGHKEIVEMLIKNGANMDANGDRLDTALAAAASSGCKETVELLIRIGANVNVAGDLMAGNVLQEAAIEGRREIVEILIKNGADVNALGMRWYGTALIGAAQRGRKEIVELLIENGADVNALGDSWYGTALQAARKRKFHEIVAILEKAGAVDVEKSEFD